MSRKYFENAFNGAMTTTEHGTTYSTLHRMKLALHSTEQFNVVATRRFTRLTARQCSVMVFVSTRRLHKNTHTNTMQYVVGAVCWRLFFTWPSGSRTLLSHTFAFPFATNTHAERETEFHLSCTAYTVHKSSCHRVVCTFAVHRSNIFLLFFCLCLIHCHSLCVHIIISYFRHEFHRFSNHIEIIYSMGICSIRGEHTQRIPRTERSKVTRFTS